MAKGSERSKTSRRKVRIRVQKAVTGEDRTVSPKKRQIRDWARAALLAGSADVTIRLVGESEGRALNRDYRGKDYATNVLTFVYDEGDVAPDTGLGDNPSMQGDLVLCVPVVARESREQGKALDAHFAHLVAHGMLHLQGFDHERTEDADAMESLEIGILAALNYGNPYDA